MYRAAGGATALEGSSRGDTPPASPGPASTAGQQVQLPFLFLLVQLGQ